MLASIAILVSVLALPIASQVQAEVDRLAGHEVRVTDDGYEIVDVAGEGPPLVGCVVKSDQGLELENRGTRYLLHGPLAVPRIAGPGYKVWVVGKVTDGVMDVRRLGILAGIAKSGCAARIRPVSRDPRSGAKRTATEPRVLLSRGVRPVSGHLTASRT